MAAPRGWERARKLAARCGACLTNALCSAVLGLLLVGGVALFVAWLALRPHRPRFRLADFSFPGLAAPAGPAGTRLSFNVSAQNPSQHVALYYDSVRAAVEFDDALVASGPATSPWYQPNMTTAAITGELDVVGPTAADSAWAAFAADVQAGRVPLRLRLTAAVRFRASVFDSGRHTLHVDCGLAVGGDGNLLPESVGASCDRYF